MQQSRISDLAYNAAQRFGNKTALTLPGLRSFSFQDIDDLAGRMAGAFAARGLQAGDRIVLHLPNGWQWVVAYHAIARLGAVVVPANFLLSAEEVAFILDNSEAAALIVPADRRASFQTKAHVFTLGEAPEAEELTTLLDGEYRPPVERRPDDLFTIGYTSGTTGRPKGATMTHAGLFASLAGTATIHVRHDGDAVLTSLPFPHVYGNIVMNATFLVGSRLITTPRFDAAEALRLISAEKATLFEGVPTMFYQMLAHPNIANADLTSLTRCTVGGQTMPTAKIDAVTSRFGCPLLELWGMTEVAGPAITHSPYWSPRSGSIGLPMPGLEVRLADLEEPTREATPGRPGELLVRGAMVTKGYWRNEAATIEAIDPDGWLATGDIARTDADGYIFVVDRKKDMIITAGYNVYPAELEQLIAMHPAVAMVAVAGIADEEKGEIAQAFVVPHRDTALSEEALLNHCRKHLASYKIPRRVIFVEDLPKNSTGKVLRRSLREANVPA
ncbi:long-chain-fatty-acid--CoA ligase (plasmid) [Agrobacterium vitis]|uniref:AMP-binding protein n=1 Tax=Agrobacterium vitis TaxID=373 RepID=UPI0015D9AD1E|nr:AMP-binding protein [Agrobacterium vitis]BCH67410.1 long-chain-fatty-acid--CoA ligase [Agrobacterium vitis]